MQSDIRFFLNKATVQKKLLICTLWLFVQIILYVLASCCECPEKNYIEMSL